MGLSAAQKAAGDPNVIALERLKFLYRKALQDRRFDAAAQLKQYAELLQRQRTKAVGEYRESDDPMRQAIGMESMEFPEMPPPPEFSGRRQAPRRPTPAPQQAGGRMRKSPQEWQQMRSTRFKSPQAAELYRKLYVDIVQ